MASYAEKSSLETLPDEILSLILRSNSTKDIVSVASSSKQLYEVIYNDQILWKQKFEKRLPNIFEILNNHDNVNWLKELKKYHNQKQLIMSELCTMSEKYFWKNDNVALEDVEFFTETAFSDNFSFYYTLHTLHSILNVGKKNLKEFRACQPYTLTEIHYAQIVLQYLMHIFLALKYTIFVKKCRLPEMVLNFFLQWVDTDDLHLDEKVEDAIKQLYDEVHFYIGQTYRHKQNHLAVHQQLEAEAITEKDILASITTIIYRQRHIALTRSYSLDSLDIIKVLNNNFGNIDVIPVLYHAVARKCGLTCELKLFQNHRFLEWIDTKNKPAPKAYIIDLESGCLKQKGRCPFSLSNESSFHFDPDFFLEYLVNNYYVTMGEIVNRNTQNATLLLEFLWKKANDRTTYNIFRHFVLDDVNLPADTVPLNFMNLHPEHLDILRSIAKLKTPTDTGYRQPIVKNRDRSVEFAIGIICYHVNHEYLCVILGWDLSCAMEGWAQFASRPDQPFYHVLAIDQSERYVAQEYLKLFSRPTRLEHLEAALGRSFSHFEGRVYVPNAQKSAEYPGDGAVQNALCRRMESRPATRI